MHQSVLQENTAPKAPPIQRTAPLVAMVTTAVLSLFPNVGSVRAANTAKVWVFVHQLTCAQQASTVLSAKAPLHPKSIAVVPDTCVRKGHSNRLHVRRDIIKTCFRCPRASRVRRDSSAMELCKMILCARTVFRIPCLVRWAITARAIPPRARRILVRQALTTTPATRSLCPNAPHVRLVGTAPPAVCRHLRSPAYLDTTAEHLLMTAPVATVAVHAALSVLEVLRSRNLAQEALMARGNCCLLRLSAPAVIPACSAMRPDCLNLEAIALPDIFAPGIRLNHVQIRTEGARWGITVQ